MEKIVHIMVSSFPDASFMVHGVYFSTLPVCMQHAPHLFAALCVPLGFGCSLEVGFCTLLPS